MSRSHLHLIAAIVVLSPTVAAAQTPATPPPGCPAEVRRQFDFWVGNWDVTVGGKPAGENRIERILEGCALLENWSGAGGMSGKSLNFYDPPAQQWHQTWVDDRGGSLGLDGTFAGGSMVLQGTQQDQGRQDDAQSHHLDCAAIRPGPPAVGHLERRRQVVDDRFRRAVHAQEVTPFVTSRSCSHEQDRLPPQPVRNFCNFRRKQWPACPCSCR